MNSKSLFGLFLIFSAAAYAGTEMPSTFSRLQESKAEEKGEEFSFIGEEVERIMEALPPEDFSHLVPSAGGDEIGNEVIIPHLPAAIEPAAIELKEKTPPEQHYLKLPAPQNTSNEAETLAASSNSQEVPTTTETKPEALQQSLQEALVHVYNSHPQLLAEREKLKAIDESVALAVSDFRPNATADYSKGRERKSASKAPWSYGETESKGLTVTQPIFSGGDGIAGFIGAKERVKAARADLIAAEQQVLFNVVVAFSDVVEKQSVLSLTQNNVDVLTKQRDAAQIRFEVGELTKTDVAQAESRLATAKSSERMALGDLEIARANFNRAVGYPPTVNMVMPELPTGLPETIEQATQLANEADPVLKAAKHREEAFASDVWKNIGGILPDVSLEGSMRRSEGGFSNRYDTDALTVNVVIPLYQSGAEWSRLRESRNLAAQAKYTTIDISLAVLQNVTNAWQNYTTAQAIIISSQAAVDAAKLALEGVRQENEFGVRTVLDVLDAEQEALDTQVNLVRAVRNEKIQAYRLLASTGRLTAKQLGLPVEVYDPKEYYNSKKYQLLGW